MAGLPSGGELRHDFPCRVRACPIAVARCDPRGLIVEMNPAFERTLDRGVASRRRLRLSELVCPQDRDKTESLLRELFDSRHDSIDIEARVAGHEQTSAKWTAWRQPGCAGEPDHALLTVEQSMAEQSIDTVPAQESLLQAQRWEAAGRLTGGVVHDFNNLLTGVMLRGKIRMIDNLARDMRLRLSAN